MSKQPIEDYLDEDEPINGQKYALVSFLSPENVLEKKEQFFFERFLQNYEVEWKVKGMETFLAEQAGAINRGLDEKANVLDASGATELADLCRSSRVRIETIMEDYPGFVRKQLKDSIRPRLSPPGMTSYSKNRPSLRRSSMLRTTSGQQFGASRCAP